jgi:DNA-binding transcriptional ArsR family regulator
MIMGLGNMDVAQAMRNKKTRGQIMRTLAIFYPDPIMVCDLKVALITRGINSIAELEGHLKYLEDAGYIRIKDGLDKTVREDDLIEITTKGTKLLEGDLDDTSVML